MRVKAGRKRLFGKVVEQLEVVSSELNALSSKSVEEAKVQLENETQQKLAIANAKADVERARAANAAAVARVNAANADNVERDLGRKRMSLFKRFGTWVMGES
jgi:hypothetical protein